MWDMNGSNVRYEWIKCEIWMAEMWDMNGSNVRYEWIKCEIWMDQMWDMNGSNVRYEWVKSIKPSAKFPHEFERNSYLPVEQPVSRWRSAGAGRVTCQPRALSGRVYHERHISSNLFPECEIFFFWAVGGREGQSYLKYFDIHIRRSVTQFLLSICWERHAPLFAVWLVCRPVSAVSIAVVVLFTEFIR
jgi:hypothetical protein